MIQRFLTRTAAAPLASGRLQRGLTAGLLALGLGCAVLSAPPAQAQGNTPQVMLPDFSELA